MEEKYCFDRLAANGRFKFSEFAPPFTSAVNLRLVAGKLCGEMPGMLPSRPETVGNATWA